MQRMKPSDAARLRVMLVEDDEHEARALLSDLGAHGFEAEHETRGDAAVQRILSAPPGAVLLDLGLPGMDGLEVCREVRTRYQGPIVVFTVRGNEVDHVLALELGADDYLVKPLAPRIVIAHLKAALRRAKSHGGNRDAAVYQFGELRVDGVARSVMLGKRHVHLTTTEFDLLWLFVTRAGEILSRDDIIVHLRGRTVVALERSVDMQVSRLRKLIGDNPGKPSRVKTIRSRGYLFVPEDT